MSTIPKVIEYLLQYSIETGTTLRSTSDLSPLEEWLLNKLQSTEQLKQHGVMQVPFNEHCIYSGLDTCPFTNMCPSCANEGTAVGNSAVGCKGLSSCALALRWRLGLFIMDIGLLSACGIRN
jgi:hypothetical protein